MATPRMRYPKMRVSLKLHLRHLRLRRQASRRKERQSSSSSHGTASKGRMKLTIPTMPIMKVGAAVSGESAHAKESLIAAARSVALLSPLPKNRRSSLYQPVKRHPGYDDE